MAELGTLRAEFDRLTFDDTTIDGLRERMVIRSASQLFADRTGVR
jgi:hypothetical protein